MKLKLFSNDLCQHLSVAIFHVKNGLIHNYFEFYKWEWLIHIWFRTIIYTLKYERSWYIDQDWNTYTNGTWTREPQSKKLNARKPTSKYNKYRIVHALYLLIFTIFSKYLTYFFVLFIGNCIVAQLQIENFFFSKRRVLWNLQLQSDAIQNTILREFPVIYIFDTSSDQNKVN